MTFTPEKIQTLKPNEIFVFGSNTQGRHGKGKTHKCFLYPELTLKGEKVSTSKLKDKQVEEIRSLYQNTNNTYEDLSKLYKISVSQIGNIIRNKQRISQ